MTRHTRLAADVGACARCGVVVVRTVAAGTIYVRDGRVLRGAPSCRWGEPCPVAMPQPKETT